VRRSRRGAGAEGPRITLRRAAVAAGALVLLGALFWALRGGGPEGSGLVPGAPRLPREFPGSVRAAGAPVPFAHVRLYEDLPGGFAAEGRAGKDGTFRLSWTPTLAVDTRALRVAAWDDAGRYAKTIADADAEGTTIDLRLPADVHGRVVDADGHPLEGVKVTVSVRHSFEEAVLTESDAEGRFTAPLKAPEGESLDLLARAAGWAARVERGFRGGDPVTIHLAPAKEVRLRLVDPRGRPVAGARARLAVPWPLAAAAPSTASGEDGRALLEDASDGSHVGIDVEAEGYLPLEASAWAGLVADVILWPARDAEVVAWDAWNSKGIEGVHFEVDPVPVSGEDWWGREPAAAGRRVPVRPGKGVGTYDVRLPRCAVTVVLSAPSYGDGTGDIPATASSATIRLQPPLSRDKPSLLMIRAPEETPSLDLIVADDEALGFLRKVTLLDGKADVLVPPGMRLQVGTGAAKDGVFLPKHTTDALRPGERRVLRIGPRPARRLRITTEPPIDGEATLVAANLVRFVAPVEAPVEKGHAEFWVAPFRSFHLEIAPPPGFFPHEADVDIEGEDKDLDLRLLPAVRLSFEVTDGAGNPVPFARALVYEPQQGGRMALEQKPREAIADATGMARFDALRGGDAAAEISAELFRSERRVLHLPRDGEVMGGNVALEPCGVLDGVVKDTNGAPVPGVQVRVLEPRISWLALPGGGSRQLYDLTEGAPGDAITDDEGHFAVPDRSPGPPLIGLFPRVASTLAPMAFEPGESYVLEPAAFVELELPSSPEGVYVLLGAGKAVLVKNDTPLSLRPLPLLLPAGASSLYVKLRDWRWGAKEVDLKAGETVRLELDWKR
jgi:protocatechuate 3,4-dioxygenase beta subunit